VYTRWQAKRLQHEENVISGKLGGSAKIAAAAATTTMMMMMMMMMMYMTPHSVHVAID
jgi:methylglyoxal synthase